MQFRIEQIGTAEAADRERLMAELGQFAFAGAPDIVAAVRAKNERQRRRSSSVRSENGEGISSDRGQNDHPR